MIDDPSLVASEEPADSVKDVFTRLYADGRAYAGAEIERQKLRAGIAGSGVRDAAILGVSGFMILFAGLIAFLVGIVLALAPEIGAAWAAVLVFGSTLILTVILLLVAKARITRMRKAIRP